MALTASEQYFLELVNRARLDPSAESKRQKEGLNADLAPNTISTASKQVLAVQDQLTEAAKAHSQWMIDADVFAHKGKDDSQPWDRAVEAGYRNTNVGENLAMSLHSMGQSFDAKQTIDDYIKGLFDSEGHRKNWMHESWGEVGINQGFGVFIYQQNKYDVALLTNKFGATPTDQAYLTGVVYADLDKDDFYSIGEGRGNTSFKIGTQTITNEAAGGYSLLTDAKAGVQFSGVMANGKAFGGVVDLSQGNVKFDIVDGKEVFTSGSVTLKNGLNIATLLGKNDLNLTGNGAANTLNGNSGSNVLKGVGGKDQLYGKGGDDFIFGGAGADLLEGNAGHDKLYGGAGADLLFGGAGRDLLDGGAGNDTLTGGAGQDHFVFQGKIGNDQITDFKRGQSDRLMLDDDLWSGQLTAKQVVNQFATITSDGVLFDFGANGSIYLLGVSSLNGLPQAIDLI